MAGLAALAYSGDSQLASFAASLPHTHDEADEEGVDEPEPVSHGDAHQEELREREAASKKAAEEKNRLR